MGVRIELTRSLLSLLFGLLLFLGFAFGSGLAFGFFLSGFFFGFLSSGSGLLNNRCRGRCGSFFLLATGSQSHSCQQGSDQNRLVHLGEKNNRAGTSFLTASAFPMGQKRASLMHQNQPPCTSAERIIIPPDSPG